MMSPNRLPMLSRLLLNSRLAFFVNILNFFFHSNFEMHFPSILVDFALGKLSCNKCERCQIISIINV